VGLSSRGRPRRTLAWPHRAPPRAKIVRMRRVRLAVALLAGALTACRGERQPGVLAVAMDQDVLTLDPHAHDDSVTHSVLANVYESLVTFDREMRIVPALAEGWSNPTDLTWVFRLRTGVRFHDGRPFSARDVKWSLERARRMKLTPNLLSVTRIDVVDDTTVELGTVAPEPVLLNKLAGVGIVPAGTPEPIGRAVGTGPYRVVEYLPGRALRLSANESYWGGEPSIGKAEFRVLPDSAARARALVAGDILLARELKRSDLAGAPPNVRFVTYPGLIVVFLGVNFRFPGPLLQKEVRQAIYWALDPRELVDLSGIEATRADEIVPPSVFGFLPGRREPRPQLERARSLLASAGYPDGFEATLEMSRAFAPAVGPPLERQLARVGIRVRVVGLDWARLSERLDRRESPFFSVGWSCNGDASHILEGLLHSHSPGSWGASNFGAWENRSFDRVVERARGILRPEERIEALHEAMLIALDELPLIPVYNRARTYGVDDRIRFEPRLNGQVLLREISWSDAPAR
jgi:peptide/nickel transport system substrate-binding protein